MAHRSISVSEEAYRALETLKHGKESFSDVILRITRRNNAKELLDVLAEIGPDAELAASVERVLGERPRMRPRRVKL